jgi:para-nitrobenzyl esterase
VAGSEASGPVIGVAIAYRLNVMGFMAAAELSAEQGGASGNYGVMDQQLALRWVQVRVRARVLVDKAVTRGGDST